jgi:hypothetical protein
MKWLKSIITSISIMLAGMFGGQKNKGVRRFGIPGLSLLASWWAGFQWKDLGLLLLMPILMMGYGDNSVYMSVFKADWLVRLMYGLTLAIPFIFYGVRRFVVAVVLLPIAYLLRAGSLGHISFFGDILIEDIVRYLTLGVLISWCLFFRQRR